MRIVFFGTPAFAVPILEMLHQEHEVILVVTQPDKPYGRKKVLQASLVKEKALSLELPVFQPVNLRLDYQRIIDLKPDLLITAAYGQMLPKELLDQVTSLNVHGSLLPAYRGGAPIQYALFDGLKKTGITIMYMAMKMDSGDIIKQESIEISPSDDYEKLSYKLSILGAKLLKEVLNDLKKGKINRYPQDESKVTYAKTLKESDELISFYQTTDQIINRMRGLSPEPGASAWIHGIKYKFYEAKKSDIINNNETPGTILETYKKLIIKTQDGAIEMLVVQMPGKKKMAAKDFLNGQNTLNVGDQFIEGMNKNAR